MYRVSFPPYTVLYGDTAKATRGAASNLIDGGKKTVLLTLGRLPVALDLARSFSASGWRVIIAEPFGMHLTRMSRSVSACYRTRAPLADRQGYLDDLREIIVRENVELVVPVSEEAMHVAALKNAIETVEFFCIAQSGLLELHDKLRFNKMACGFGLNVPPSCAADDEALSSVTHSADFVVKPRLGCSGRGVQYFARGTRGPFAADALVQKRLDGESLSSFSITRNGKVMCTAVYAARVVSGSVAVCFERKSGYPAVEEWVAAFVAQTQHSGFIGFDFIMDADGCPAAIECNPRATSGIHFIETAQIAAAICDADVRTVKFRSETLLQEGYSCFTATLAVLHQPGECRRRFEMLRSARDISWSRDDPWPFLLMMINSYRLIGLALLRRRTFAEVAALDIEWSGV